MDRGSAGLTFFATAGTGANRRPSSVPFDDNGLAASGDETKGGKT
jgi:hypothetical protein